MIVNSEPDPAVVAIDLAETADFQLGSLFVFPSRREVCFDGARRELEPKVAQVLVALAAARPQVLSRERLIGLCWGGRIVGEDALNRCIVALRHLARDFAPGSFAIETVARVGYCLIELPAENSASERHEASPSTGWRHWVAARRIPLGALAMAAVLGGALYLVGPWRTSPSEAAPASIAVLPFRNLSAGDPFFAEGIGEEILTRLAREPQFRVAGRSSASELRGGASAQEVGRRLAVNYVLEGSVRTQGDRIRVNAALVKTKDNVQLWSNSYDGKLDDVFAIQERIGDAIAVALRRKLVRVPDRSGPLVTNGEAYGLYLTARGLIRLRQPKVGGTAVNLLRDAIKIDPAFAPAWASLAVATQQNAASRDHESVVTALPKAQAHARHALRLAPDLDEAHRALAQVLGYGSAEGQLHFRRAAELDPNNAENLIGLGNAQGAVGEFSQELASYRRAGELDPLWYRTIGATAIATAELGDRGEAEAIARRAFANNKANLHIALGRIAWILGDFSEAIHNWAIVARSDSPRWSNAAQRGLDGAAYTIGLGVSPRRAMAPPLAERYFERVWLDMPPTVDVWQTRNRDSVSALVYRAENLVGAKLMFNAGRPRELAATYDKPGGLLGLRPRQPPRVDQLSEVAIVAATLKQVGRTADADSLVGKADRAIREVYRRNKVPFWFDAAAAEVWAVQGRTDDALTALERAVDRGWAHAGRADLPSLANEPAFAPLRGNPRFDRLCAKIAAIYARERRETRPLLPLPKQREVT